jgi:RND superfamily putative drug exporter
VFAFTMASMVGSDMRAIGQFGSTVCVGLLLDTLIVRTLLMPSIATLLGRWFWWPQVVHRRGVPRQAVSSPARGPRAEVTTQRLGPGAMNLGERQ